MARALLYIGGVNRGIGYVAKPAGAGIAAFEIELDTGASKPLGVTSGIDNPTFVAVAPDGRSLAAVSEIDGWHEGLVTAYEIDRATGALRYLNMQPARGDYTCHLGFDRSGRYVGIANYGGLPVNERPNRSFAVYPRAASGALEPPSAQATHTGSGPIAGRQDRPHAHCIGWSADNRFVLVADLGIDQLVIYRFDEKTGSVTAHSAGMLPAGAGPRHFVFHPDLSVLYCVGEIDCTLVTMRYDGEAGTLQTLARTSTLPGRGQAGSSGSAIALTADARFLYVGNRGHDSIARFGLDPKTGAASLLGITPTGGRIPRDFTFDPTGTVLAVANQESDLVTLFRYLPESGDLDAIASIAVGSPTVVAFHPELS